MQDLIYRQKGRDERYKIWHKPPKNMFILIEEGKGSIVTRDKSYPMEKGSLCFVGINKYHYTFPDIPEEYIRSKLFVDSEDLEKITSLLSRNQTLCNILSEDRIAMGKLNSHDLLRAEKMFEELYALKTDTVYFQAKVYSVILDLTVLISKSMEENVPQKSDNIQIAVEYINRHIAEEIKINQICASCYLSKYHFCRLFKERVGVTVMEYILKTRIANAKELLSDGSLSVTEISGACGFSSISYFSRAFKNETGMTPLQYKKKYSKAWKQK